MLNSGVMVLNIPGPKIRRPRRARGYARGLRQLGLKDIPQVDGAEMIKTLGKTVIAASILGFGVWAIFLRG